MNFFKWKFFIISFIIIFLIFIFQFLIISESYKVDRNSYVTLIEWNWILTSDWKKVVLKIDKKELIKTWDSVSIVWKESLAIIEWWDKSITRLSWNSKIIIKENFISDDLWKINISFELLKWKTWSNVVTILWDNSYFKQDIKWVTASVRWTVFEANYDSDYLYVADHEVKVSNTSWETKTLYTWEWIRFSSFSLADLIQIRDKVWAELNDKMDVEYYKQLREELLNSVKETPFYLKIAWIFSTKDKVMSYVWSWDYVGLWEYVASLSWSTKEEAVNYLKTLNQQFNFEEITNPETYADKLNIRNILLENVGDTTYKESLLKYTIYDISWNLDYASLNQALFWKTIEMLDQNRELLESSWNLQFLDKNLSGLKEFLLNWNSDVFINSVKGKLLELDSVWKETINNSLDSILNIFSK